LENLTIPGTKANANGTDWSGDDFLEIADDRHQSKPGSLYQEYFYGVTQELLECLHVKPDQIKKCARELTRLAAKNWYLTKQTYVFKPDEMQDLEFQPAIPLLAKKVEQPYGSVAAAVLAQCGPDGVTPLLTACKSSNAVERVNASIVLQQTRDERRTSLVLNLMNDPEPKARLRAVEAAKAAWDPKFIEPLQTLFHDEQPEVRSDAVECLGDHEPPTRLPFYVQLFGSPDPEIQEGAVGVVSRIYWIRRRSTDPLAALDPALDLLRSSSPRVRSYALHLLWSLNRFELTTADHARLENGAVGMLKDQDLGVQEAALILLLEAKEVDPPRETLLPLLGSPSIGNVFMTLKALNLNLQTYGAPQGTSAWPRHESLRTWDPETKDRLSSLEAAPLTTNRLTFVRLIELKFLQLNGDAAAIDLTLPLLSDEKPIVRRRAVDVLRLLSGEKSSEDDPVRWAEWWKTNKAAFEARSQKAVSQ
jgi:HEAT repeat protein